MLDRWTNLLRHIEQTPIREDREWRERDDGNPFDLGDEVKSVPRKGHVVNIDYSRENKQHDYSPVKVRWDDIDEETWEDYLDLEKA